VKTIRFQDNGQDFLTWQIDEQGNVVDCQPFQAFVWVGCIVLNHATLKAGEKVEILNKDGHEMTVRHLVERITGSEPRKSSRCPYQPRTEMEAL
jgi:hypothetical protein